MPAPQLRQQVPAQRVSRCAIDGLRRSGVSRQRVRAAAEQRSRPASSNIKRDNVLVVGLVTAITETLRVLGVGRDRYEQVVAADAQQAVARLPAGDVQGVMTGIEADFKQRKYIITGLIDDAIYDPQCLFADPTVSFSGLALWKRNLQLLTPFLIEPEVEMLEPVRRLGANEAGQETLRSEWRLETYLSLPWRPRISILGATVYTLNEELNQVVAHEESWNVTGAQALMQMLRPGGYQQQRAAASGKPDKQDA